MTEMSNNNSAKKKHVKSLKRDNVDNEMLNASSQLHPNIHTYIHAHTSTHPQPPTPIHTPTLTKIY